MKTGVLLAALAFAGAVWAEERAGISPRARAEDYAARADGIGGLTIAATIIPPDQVERSFASEIHGRWIVAEVAVYPGKDGAVTINRDDFVLKVRGTRTNARPASPKAMAGILQKSGGSDRDVTLYPTVGIGYESGPRRYDPVYGDRGGGVRTSVGIGVGVGGGPPTASTEADRKTMELELSEKALPEEKTDQPVAGYLYFPLPPKKKSVEYELEYSSKHGPLVLVFPPAAPDPKKPD